MTTYPSDPDWTRGADGRSNTSASFRLIEAEIARLIRSEAHTLLAGDTELAAGLILAQLAHKRGLAPAPGAILRDGDERCPGHMWSINDVGGDTVACVICDAVKMREHETAVLGAFTDEERERRLAGRRFPWSRT